MAKGYWVCPDPNDKRLAVVLQGQDYNGEIVEMPIIRERPLTLSLNSQEIVTINTIGDYPDLLAIGYFLNQNLLKPDDVITSIELEGDIDTIVVRTERDTEHDMKLTKKVGTSGGTQGAIYADLTEDFDPVTLDPQAIIRTTWLYSLQHTINTTPSLYQKLGAMHGCVLCKEDQPLIYVEEIGRHNAIDKIAGYMFQNKIQPEDKILYTTGRLTHGMVIKAVQMGIPILLSRSGFTSWGVDLARRSGLTLIGRIRGKRFIVLSGEERVVYELDNGRAAET